jgi:hypothetical protein
MARTKSKQKLRASARKKRKHRVNKATEQVLRPVGETVPKPNRVSIQIRPDIQDIVANGLKNGTLEIKGPSKIDAEDIGKLSVSFGLSGMTRSILRARGIYTVGALVEKLRRNEKIYGIGSERMKDIKSSLALAGVTI